MGENKTYLKPPPSFVVNMAETQEESPVFDKPKTGGYLEAWGKNYIELGEKMGEFSEW